MSNQPVPMSYEALAAVLRGMADLVEREDSWEGSIEYLMPSNEDIENANQQPPPDVMVRASFRIGNTQGQGGIRIIGTLGQ